VRRLQKEAAQVANYEEADAKLKRRNSCSKTDVDAVVMPMKQSQEFKPGYNLQASAENGFVTGFTLGTNSNDGSSLKGHLEHQKKLGLPQPQELVSDAGYGHEEVYEALQEAGIEALVKYKDYAVEHRTRGKAAYHHSKFHYDPVTDGYTCPQGRWLAAHSCREEARASGYLTRQTEYRSASCAGCPARDLCLRGEADRSLKISHKLEAHKARTRQKLDSPEGQATYRQRSHQIETPFGDMKSNQGFRRFRLRGLVKNTLDLALFFTAYNLRKLAKAAFQAPIPACSGT
jgi:hypothetical protein